MKKTLLAAVLILVVSACTVMQEVFNTDPLPVDSAMTPLAQTAQRVVNEANGLLAGMAITINQDARAGIISRAEELRHQGTFREYARALDDAQDAIDKCVKTGLQCDIIPDKEKVAGVIKSGLQSLREALAKRRGAR